MSCDKYIIVISDIFGNAPYGRAIIRGQFTYHQNKDIEFKVTEPKELMTRWSSLYLNQYVFIEVPIDFMNKHKLCSCFLSINSYNNLIRHFMTKDVRYSCWIHNNHFRKYLDNDYDDTSFITWYSIGSKCRNGNNLVNVGEILD